MSLEYLQRLFNQSRLGSPERVEDQPSHAVSNMAVDLFQRYFRKTKIAKGKIDGDGEIFFGVDESSIEIQNQERDRIHPTLSLRSGILLPFSDRRVPFGSLKRQNPIEVL